MYNRMWLALVLLKIKIKIINIIFHNLLCKRYTLYICIRTRTLFIGDIPIEAFFTVGHVYFLLKSKSFCCCCWCWSCCCCCWKLGRCCCNTTGRLCCNGMLISSDEWNTWLGDGCRANCCCGCCCCWSCCCCCCSNCTGRGVDSTCCCVGWGCCCGKRCLGTGCCLNCGGLCDDASSSRSYSSSASKLLPG